MDIPPNTEERLSIGTFFAGYYRYFHDQRNLTRNYFLDNPPSITLLKLLSKYTYQRTLGPVGITRLQQSYIAAFNAFLSSRLYLRYYEEYFSTSVEIDGSSPYLPRELTYIYPQDENCLNLTSL